MVCLRKRKVTNVAGAQWDRGRVRGDEGERACRVKHVERALYPTVRCVGFKSEEMNYIFRSEEMRL